MISSILIGVVILIILANFFYGLPSLLVELSGNVESCSHYDRLLDQIVNGDYEPTISEEDVYLTRLGVNTGSFDYSYDYEDDDSRYHNGSDVVIGDYNVD